MCRIAATDGETPPAQSQADEKGAAGVMTLVGVGVVVDFLRLSGICGMNHGGKNYKKCC